ncbi:MAG: 1-acyl-sn-glycerol-3-phosphate acyltransferase [Solirubrobacterales bacterium]|nr:1-acyl-sn-glycerol-3-phosphate acyltransferase [Solirubrobacterales bacterium]
MSEIKNQVYRDERPAEAMAPFHEWARTHEPGWTYTATRILLTPIVLGLYRARSTGRGNIPATGGFILAPNHFSNMDHFFCGVFLKRRIRFMTKSQFFGNNPVLSGLFRIAGHFPVRRGHDDQEAFATAHLLLEAGGCVGMYAEGGRSRTGGLGSPRPGIGRLALESGVPVVPVAIHGSKAVRQWRRGRFPAIRVSYGTPLTLARVVAPTREQSLAAAERIFDEVRALYAALDAGA